MKRFGLLVSMILIQSTLALLLKTVSASPSAPAPLSDKDFAIAGIQLYMPYTEALKKLGKPENQIVPKKQDNDLMERYLKYSSLTIGVLSLYGGPPDVGYIDIKSQEPKTCRGVGVGLSAKLLERYPPKQRSKYSPPGKISYELVGEIDFSSIISFSIKDGVITGITMYLASML